MTRKCVLLFNPLSGGYTPEKIKMALSALRGFGLDPESREVLSPEEAAAYAEEACANHHPPLLVVAGGDGTINGVVNGLIPGRATIAVLPFGTSNVLARELGISTADQALEKIAAGVSRPATVGCVEKGDTGRYFLLMAGIGVDGEIVKGVRTREKRLLKKGAYLLSALRLISAWKTDRLEVVSGDRVTDCHSVIVCNASKYAGNAIIAPSASLFDPELRVVCLTDGTRTAILKAAWSLMAGTVSGSAGICTFSAREVEVRGVKPLQADGDYYLEAPVHIRTIPDFLRIIV